MVQNVKQAKEQGCSVGITEAVKRTSALDSTFINFLEDNHATFKKIFCANTK